MARWRSGRRGWRRPPNAGWPGWPLAGDRAGRRVGYRPALGGAGTTAAAAAAAAGGPAVFVVLLLPPRDGPRALSVTRPSAPAGAGWGFQAGPSESLAE